MIELDTTPEYRAKMRILKKEQLYVDFYKKGLEILEDAVGQCMACDDNGNFEYQGLKGKISSGKINGENILNIFDIKITHNCVERFFNWKKFRFEERIVQKESCCLSKNDVERILAEHNYCQEWESVCNSPLIRWHRDD